MKLTIGKYVASDVPQMREIWNEIVAAGNAFPQEDELTPENAIKFFSSQSHCGVARKPQSHDVAGFYILHPNNVGRCGHICNASYAVAQSMRGEGIGKMLVMDSLKIARSLGFGIMQFNAVVVGNEAAHKLYSSLGFKKLGLIPAGFRNKTNVCEDICLYYYDLRKPIAGC